MPVITQLTEQKRRPNRRNVFLDGDFAFGVNLNVVAAFGLRPGLSLTDEQVLSIQRGEVRQECFDKAIAYLSTRLHGRAELRQKLMRREYGPAVIDSVLDDLARLGYLDDAKFAAQKAESAAKHKHLGKRRAAVELMKAGVARDVAGRAIDAVYDQTDPIDEAKQFAARQAARLARLDPAVARRRLVGMLQRRGFDFDAIGPAVEAVLGRAVDE